MDGTRDAQEVFTRAWHDSVAWFKATYTPPCLESLEPMYCDKALGFIPKRCWVRKQLLLLTHTRIFELVVLMAITANCVTLALDSNAPGFRESTMGRRLQLADYVFTGFFSVEMVLKVIAMGLIAAPNTYLRSGWNLLDVSIICTGYISLAGYANVTALRGIRALRPLRTITRIKQMKVVVSALVSSMPALLDVTMVMALYFAIFGTMCVLLFGGALSHRCADPDFSHAYTDASGYVQGVHYIVPDADKGDVCKNTRVRDVRWRNMTDTSTGQIELTPTHTTTSVNGWAFDCDFRPSADHPYGQFCAPFKNPGAGDFPDYVPGYNSFDNILESWLAVFQHVTATDWAFVMFEVQDGVNWWTWILHFFMNFMGAMLLINLVTAVIFMSYQKGMAGDDKDDEDPEMVALNSGGDKPNSAGGHLAGQEGFLDPHEPLLYGSPEVPAPIFPRGSKEGVTMNRNMIGEQSELVSPDGAKQDGEDLSPYVVVADGNGTWQQQPGRRASLLMPVREEAEGAGTVAAADGGASRRESPEGCHTHHHLTPLMHPKKHKPQPPSRRSPAELAQPVNGYHRHHHQHLQDTHIGDALPPCPTLANGHHHHHQHLQHTHSRDPLAQRQTIAASRQDLDSAHHRTALCEDSVLDANPSTKGGASTKSAGGSADDGRAKSSKGGTGEGDSDVTLPEFPPIGTVSEEEEEEQRKECDLITRRGSSVAYPSPSFFDNKLTQAVSMRQSMKIDEHKLQELDRESEAGTSMSCQSSWVVFRTRCLQLVMSPGFNIFNAAVIFTNAIVLGLNWYLMPPKLERAMYIMNYAFTSYFVVEVILRLVARGADFFTTRMNWFDFLITMASFAEMLVELQPGPEQARFGGGLTAIRLLRLFRLARYWDGLNQILVVLGYAFSSGVYLFALVLLFMFVAGLLGMQLFGYKSAWCGIIAGASQRCAPGQDCPAHWECFVDCTPAQLGQWFEVEHSPYNGLAYCERFPRGYDPIDPGNESSWPLYWAQVGKPVVLQAHFDNMLHAFLTVFIIITCDNWTDIMYPMMSAINPWIALYFIIVITLGSFFLLQLFLAILLGGLDKLDEMKELDRLKHEPKVSTAISQFFHSTLSNLRHGLKSQVIASTKTSTRDKGAGDDGMSSKKLHFSSSSHGNGSVKAGDGLCVELEQQQGKKQQQQQQRQQQEKEAKLASTQLEAASSIALNTGASRNPSTTTNGRLSAIAPRVGSLLSRGNRISPSSSCLPPASSESDIIRICEPTPSYFHSCLAAPFEANLSQQQQQHRHSNQQQQQQQQQPTVDLRTLDLSAPVHDNLLFDDTPTPTLHSHRHSGPPVSPISHPVAEHTNQHNQHNHHPHTASGPREPSLLYPPTSFPSIPDERDSHLRFPKLAPTSSAHHTPSLPPVHLNPNSPQSLSQALPSHPPHPPTSSTSTGERASDTPFAYKTGAESFLDMSSSDFSMPARSPSTRAQPSLPTEGGAESTGAAHASLPSSDLSTTARSPGTRAQPSLPMERGAESIGAAHASLPSSDFSTPARSPDAHTQPGLPTEGGADSTGAAHASLPMRDLSAPARSTVANAQAGGPAEGATDSTGAGDHASLPSRRSSRRHLRTPVSWAGERFSSSSEGAGDRGGKEKKQVQKSGPSGGPELQDHVHGSWPGELPSEHPRNLDTAWGEGCITCGPPQAVGEAVQFGPEVTFGSFGPPWGGQSSGSYTGSTCPPHHGSTSDLDGRVSESSEGRASQRHSMMELEGRGSKKQTLTDVRARRDSMMVLERARQAAEEAEGLQGYSCFCLGPHNPVRIAIAKVVNHNIFISFINAMVLVSCVVLMLDVISLDPKSKKGIVLRNLDAATTAVFGVEVVLRAMHQGVLFNGPNSYLRNGWNFWDVFVVAISVVVLSIDASQVETPHWLAALRALRALRVLHAACCVEGIRVVLKALGQLIPTLTNVLWVGALFYYVFAVLGVALLSGKMHYCADEENGEYIDPYYVLPQGETISKTWCIASDIYGSGAPRTITTSHYHSQIGVEVPPWNITTSWTRDMRRFDNVGTALWVLFQMASVELWSDVMFHTQAAVGRDTQPIPGANEHIGLLWVLFMFIGSFTVLSLIVGVSINKFYEIKEEAGGQSLLLTTQQQQWLTVQQMLAGTHIEDTTVPSNNRFRHLVHKLVYNKIVDNAMMLIIIANTIVMFFAHYNMNQQYERAVNITNIAVTVIFFVEFAAKITAVGVRTYCKSSWNVFDALITALSIVGVLVDNLSADSDAAFLPVIRVLRVVRILRLIPRAKGVRKLIRTLYWSFPAVSNVAFVLLVFMYLWAIVGMNLFGNVKFTDNGAGNNHNRNFRHFPMSMITLFTMLTGEDWNDLMLDLMQKEDCWLVEQDVDFKMPGGDGDIMQVVLDKGQYLDPVNDHRVLDYMRSDSELRGVLMDQCSINPMLAVLFCCIFILVCSYIMVQLVIGIILDNIQAATFMENTTVGEDDVNEFIAAWEELDPYGTSYIHVKQLTTLLSQVPPPLGIRGLPHPYKRVQEIILGVDIPLRNHMYVHFLEVLHALAGRIAGAQVPAEEELHVHRRLAKRVPEGVPLYTAAHVYAAMAVAGAVRGYLQRVALKDVWEAFDKEDLDEVISRGDEVGACDRLVDVMQAKGKSISPAEAKAYLRRLTRQDPSDDGSDELPPLQGNLRSKSELPARLRYQ